MVYPPATLDSASRQISLLCQDVIFGDTDDEEELDDDEQLPLCVHRVFCYVTMPPECCNTIQE